MVQPDGLARRAFEAGLEGLNEAQRLFDADRPVDAMIQLEACLRWTHAALPADDWADFVRAAREHEVRRVVHLCPLTRASYEKARGYAGDPVVLDYMYGLAEGSTFSAHPSTTPGQVYNYAICSPVASAVRYRRSRIADLIDEIARERGPKTARVLSIAAGHLREAELSRAIQDGDLAEMRAIDQNSESVDIVDATYAHLGVVADEGSVNDLIRARKRYSNYDLVYAAGLFDSLWWPVASRLAEIMLNAVRPGGKVMIANFVPEITSAPFLEVFMDWQLIYRTKDELAELFANVRHKIASLELWEDPHSHIAFVTATRL